MRISNIDKIKPLNLVYPSIFIELHLEIGFSVIHMGLVLAISEKTQICIKIKQFFRFLPPGILNLAGCILFWKICRHYDTRIDWKHVSSVICLNIVLFRGKTDKNR